MEVLTKYPIVVTDSTAQTDSEYRSTYSGADGGVVVSAGVMEVITEYPIVYTGSNAQSKAEYRGTYSAAFGDGWLTTAAGRERRKKRKDARVKTRGEKQKSGTTFGDKVKTFAKSDLAKGILGKVLGGGGEESGAMETGALPPMEEPKGMSKGLKIGLIVGGVAVVGLAAWLLLRNKGGKK